MFGDHRQIKLFAKIANRHDSDELAFAGKLNEIDDRFSASRGVALGYLVDLYLKDLSVVGKDHQISVCRSDKQMLDKILILRLRPETPLAAASLTGVGGDRRAFDVAGVGDGDRDVFVGDQGLDIEFGVGIDDNRSASVTELSFDLHQFVGDDFAQHAFILENIFELRDVLDDLGVFVEDLFGVREPTVCVTADQE